MRVFSQVFGSTQASAQHQSAEQSFRCSWRSNIYVRVLEMILLSRAQRWPIFLHKQRVWRMSLWRVTSNALIGIDQPYSGSRFLTWNWCPRYLRNTIFSLVSQTFWTRLVSWTMLEVHGPYSHCHDDPAPHCPFHAIPISFKSATLTMYMASNLTSCHLSWLSAMQSQEIQ